MPGTRASDHTLPLADVRKALRRQIASAHGALRKRSALSDKAIHRARKDLKRARASLRLLRDALGDSVYSRENATLRDAAQPLGRARDAKVLLDLVAGLLARERERARRAELETLLRAAREEHRNALRELVDGSPSLEESVETLKAAEHRVANWHIQTDDASALQTGIARMYRRGRKALKDAASDPSDEKLHESRKQAKYLGQAVEVLKPQKGNRLTKIIKRAEAIADCLGDDHDLVVLEENIPANLGNAAKTLRANIEARRGELQTKAMKKGWQLYKRAPKGFMRRMRRVFDERSQKSN
jgi:CHAD domain-containing protein